MIVASLSQKTLSCLILRRRHREVHFSVLQLKFYCHWIHCASYFFIRTKISFLSTHNLLERELIFIFVFLFLSVDICRMEGSGTGGEREYWTATGKSTYLRSFVKDKNYSRLFFVVVHSPHTRIGLDAPLKAIFFDIKLVAVCILKREEPSDSVCTSGASSPIHFISWGR